MIKYSEFGVQSAECRVWSCGNWDVLSLSKCWLHLGLWYITLMVSRDLSPQCPVGRISSRRDKQHLQTQFRKRLHHYNGMINSGYWTLTSKHKSAPNQSNMPYWDWLSEKGCFITVFGGRTSAIPTTAPATPKQLAMHTNIRWEGDHRVYGKEHHRKQKVHLSKQADWR